MSTPTDPYNSRDRAPSQAEDILAPLPDGAVPGDGPADTADGDPFDLATPLKQAEPESPTASNAPSATTATPSRNRPTAPHPRSRQTRRPRDTSGKWIRSPRLRPRIPCRHSV